MASVLAKSFRTVEDPGVARRDPQPWSARHTFSIERVDDSGSASDGALWHVSRWDATAAAMIGGTVPFGELGAYFQARARVASILDGVRSPFDVRGTLEIEKQRMQAAIADRIHLAYRYASGQTPSTLHRHGAGAREDIGDFVRGIQMILRHDLLMMFAHPRVFRTPSLALTYEGPPAPVGPMDMPRLFSVLSDAAGDSVHSGDGRRGRVAFARESGADFLSADGGMSWLRLTLEEPGQSEADARHFLARITEAAALLDDAAVERADAGWRERFGPGETPARSFVESQRTADGALAWEWAETAHECGEANDHDESAQSALLWDRPHN